VECDRVLIRAEALFELSRTEVDQRRTSLRATAAHWVLLPLSPDVLGRARQPLPAEPFRTLDALHLSSALSVADSTGAITMLRLDRRIRSSARGLGFPVLPRG
jgi:hypothetical protein